MVVHGLVQHDEAVVHVVAARLEDDTAMLRHLSEDSLPSTLSAGDSAGSWRRRSESTHATSIASPKAETFIDAVA